MIGRAGQRVVSRCLSGRWFSRGAFTASIPSNEQFLRVSATTRKFLFCVLLSTSVRPSFTQSWSTSESPMIRRPRL